MTMIDGVFRRGDRVEYKRPLNDTLGILPDGAAGIVVEVYEDGHFGAAVAWPTLRKLMPADAGPLIVDGLDAHDLHEGDVVPMLSGELKVTGNVFAEGH